MLLVVVLGVGDEFVDIASVRELAEQRLQGMARSLVVGHALKQRPIDAHRLLGMPQRLISFFPKGWSDIGKTIFQTKLKCKL